MTRLLRHRGGPVTVASTFPTGPIPGRARPAHDERWPAIARALQALRATGRRAVRIVDAECGAGALLLEALHHARLLGFTAIEGRGIDGSPALIGRARAAAARRPDPAIGVVFEIADMRTALAEEAAFPADILLWHDTRAADRAAAPLLRRAADRVIGAAGDDRSDPHA
ncbi:SAM-dependent methyltransferase [Sphingomonas morindae]|uniref:SAM-dependent methyltransferase n=1 Tax=Sphingomonas morindae TaxID=1541170 RepID=A0ABY4X6G0_9SPHN|nr:SAM-dependent methyltransferase [Sphingomonas morindae]USI72490.1 SAM-dependent methyltransferase [Sphingomonas morindae]